MFGALLLSANHGNVNRNLFNDLLVQNLDYITDNPANILLMATVAVDKTGRRVKASSLSAPVGNITLDSIDPHPHSRGQGFYPPDAYSVPITDNPSFEVAWPSDILAYGSLAMHSVTSRSQGLYSSVSGHLMQDSPCGLDNVPPSVLNQLVCDDDATINFITKAKRTVLDQLSGRFAAQIISVAADPLLLILRSDKQVHLYLVESAGCFYLVWSDFDLNFGNSDHRSYVWPLYTFDRGDPTLVMGFSIRMLRNRWTRWLNPKHLPTHLSQVDMMLVPRAIAALQQWLVRHTA